VTEPLTPIDAPTTPYTEAEDAAGMTAAEPRCDADFYCGQCEDCLSGEHPETRATRASRDPEMDYEMRDRMLAITYEAAATTREELP